MPHQTQPSETLMTIPEAAAQLGVPVSTLRRAVNAGLIPAHTVFNSRRRVRIADILDAMLAQEAEAEALEASQREEAEAYDLEMMLSAKEG